MLRSWVLLLRCLFRTKHKGLITCWVMWQSLLAISHSCYCCPKAAAVKPNEHSYIPIKPSTKKSAELDLRSWNFEAKSISCPKFHFFVHMFMSVYIHLLSANMRLKIASLLLCVRALEWQRTMWQGVGGECILLWRPKDSLKVLFLRCSPHWWILLLLLLF